MANLTISSSIITAGQFTGVTILFHALLAWRIGDIAGDDSPAFNRNKPLVIGFSKSSETEKSLRKA